MLSYIIEFLLILKINFVMVKLISHKKEQPNIVEYKNLAVSL